MEYRPNIYIKTHFLSIIHYSCCFNHLQQSGNKILSIFSFGKFEIPFMVDIHPVFPDLEYYRFIIPAIISSKRSVISKHKTRASRAFILDGREYHRGVNRVFSTGKTAQKAQIHYYGRTTK